MISSSVTTIILQWAQINSPIFFILRYILLLYITLHRFYKGYNTNKYIGINYEILKNKKVHNVYIPNNLLYCKWLVIQLASNMIKIL